MAMDQMKKSCNPRKALLVLSDGGDNSSRYTHSEIKNLVREADVQVYAIGIFEPVSARGRTAEELGGPSLLSELAEQTGGRHFPVENVNELPDVAAKIGIELRINTCLILSKQHQEGWKVPPRARPARPAARASASESRIPNRILCPSQ
jgi:hypothetical protein